MGLYITRQEGNIEVPHMRLAYLLKNATSMISKIFNHLPQHSTKWSNDLQSTQASIKADIAKLEDKVNSKQATTAINSAQIPYSLEPSEIIERVERANNIIIWNAPPENVDDTAVKSLVIDLVGKIDAQAIISIVSIKRLGSRQNHSRSIKVEFHSGSVALNLLRIEKILLSHSDYKRMALSDNETPQQVRQLQEELEWSIIYTNSVSISAKFHDLLILVNDIKPALILITEPWFPSGETDQCFSIPGYSVIASQHPVMQGLVFML
ncbi:hypothetical protein HHI36_018792 [Cryptolaemus montrouzieri]|uniref:Uncharacterized protein n=1 Tax=Cryptolaemus montrouzieri TaxID=559131 RepID=A0ABD2P111_9CUCU